LAAEMPVYMNLGKQYMKQRPYPEHQKDMHKLNLKQGTYNHQEGIS
jgi:hypothetical protein